MEGISHDSDQEADVEKKELEYGEYICAVCLCLIYRPVSLAICQHTFCAMCVRSLRKSECPVCRQRISSRYGLSKVNLMIERAIESLFPKEYKQRKIDTDKEAAEREEEGEEEEEGLIEQNTISRVRGEPDRLAMIREANTRSLIAASTHNPVNSYHGSNPNLPILVQRGRPTRNPNARGMTYAQARWGVSVQSNEVANAYEQRFSRHFDDQMDHQYDYSWTDLFNPRTIRHYRAAKKSLHHTIANMSYMIQFSLDCVLIILLNINHWSLNGSLGNTILVLCIFRLFFLWCQDAYLMKKGLTRDAARLDDPE